jgi:GR25 family glycosyltransferase involved in LPS biosynthesis
MIKKAFIITLAESSFSNKLSDDCSAQASKFGMDVTIWPATNGMQAEQYFNQEKIPALLHKKIRALIGVQGCFLSHYFLWKHCIELNEPICILEHDGYFIRELPFDIENNFLDVINLDPFPQYEVTYNELVINSLVENIDYYTPNTSKGGGPQKRAKAGTYVGGAYGYCIKPEGAKKLVKFAKEIGALPADKHIGQNIVDVKMSSATIVRLHPFYSENSIRSNSTTKGLESFIDR